MHSFYGIGVTKKAFLLKLWKQVGGAFNGTGYQLWEESNISKERDRVFRRGNLSAIDINRVTERLKGIERYTYRKHDVQHIGGVVQTEQMAE